MYKWTNSESLGRIKNSTIGYDKFKCKKTQYKFRNVDIFTRMFSLKTTLVTYFSLFSFPFHWPGSKTYNERLFWNDVLYDMNQLHIIFCNTLLLNKHVKR